MATGEAVIENHWTDKVLPSAIAGLVIFLITRLWDSWQFEKKLAELEKRLTESAEKHLREFKENNVTPLKERVSKFDRTVETLQHDITELKLLTARIAEKLEVK